MKRIEMLVILFIVSVAATLAVTSKPAPALELPDAQLRCEYKDYTQWPARWVRRDQSTPCNNGDRIVAELYPIGEYSLEGYALRLNVFDVETDQHLGNALKPASGVALTHQKQVPVRLRTQPIFFGAKEYPWVSAMVAIEGMSAQMDLDPEAQYVSIVFQVPVARRLNVSAAADFTGRTVYAGETGAQVVRGMLCAGAAGAVQVQSLYFYRQTWAEGCPFSNASLYEYPEVPTIASLDGNCGAYFNTSIIVDANSCRQVSLQLDIGASASMDEDFSFALAGVGVAAFPPDWQTPVIVSGTPVNGPTFTVGQDCQHSGVCGGGDGEGGPGTEGTVPGQP